MTVDLAALRSKPHFGQSRVARHDFEINSRKRPKNTGVDGRARRRAGRAHHHLAPLEVGERLQVPAPEGTGRDFGIETANPVESRRIELRIRRVDQRLDVVTGLMMPMTEPSLGATPAR
jgi:hypothetical protein